MERAERIKAALAGKEVDRVPVSVWMHFSECDQDPRALAEAQSRFNEKYDYDFIKMMPFGAYSVQDWGTQLKIYCDKYKEPVIDRPGITCAQDYRKIQPLPAYYGTWGKQVQLAQHLSRCVKGKTPYIQTIFSPLTTLKKMAGNGLLSHMMEHPQLVHQALEAIAETTVNFVKANIEAGVSGFFFATQCATYDLLTDVLYAEFAKPYDLKVIQSYSEKTYFNVIHIHGDNIMFDTVSRSYPCTCLNWHDRHTKPSMEEARQVTSTCFLGGIQEVPYFVDGVLRYDSFLRRSTPDEVQRHIGEAIAQVQGTGVVIGPGCVADPRTPEENLKAVREAVEQK